MNLARALRGRPRFDRLPAPRYVHRDGRRVFLGVRAAERYMSSENWELQAGMEAAGYELWGIGFDGYCENDVWAILDQTQPSVVVVQDKREWDPAKPGCFDKRAAFEHTALLADRPDVFRATVLIDGHQDPHYHRQAHDEIGAHAWLHYYHRDILCMLCPWLRPEHMLRIYHSVNRDNVPEFRTERRGGAVIAGAMDHVGTYPLRQLAARTIRRGGLQGVAYLVHPGYGARGSATPGFLRQISDYRVLLATCSIYGYALRKIVEGVACGCTVVTDLPPEDELPAIDAALVRVPSEIDMRSLHAVLRREVEAWDAERAEHFARLCCDWYDWRPAGLRAAEQIEGLRARYDE